MGTLTDSLFTVLMSWVRGLVDALWALFSSDHTTALEFMGKHWLLIALALIAAGLVIDWIIWLLRWQPYHLWAQRVRRLLRMEEPEGEEEAPARGHAAAMPQRRSAVPQETEEPEEVPLYLGERDVQQVMERAESAPDEYAYPGMRYDSTARQDMDGTQRYGVVTQEGPGAAEVARRRAEIEAWQRQMQEEARARAEAEQAQRIQEAREAEQARLAQEEYEAEQARLAQEEYERQMAEYERQRAQYERDLAEYERQKAAYDAQRAREAAAQQRQEFLPGQGTARRRRSARRSYSDYVEGEDVSDLPDAPQWPQMPDTAAPAQPEQKKAGSKLLGRMAKMIEPEEEQLAALPKLPPRVNVQDAYRPAASPEKPDRRFPRG